MNTKLIEQIKQIKGVKTVISSGETCVVTFEPKEKTLEDYEPILLDSNTTTYRWLKVKDPAIYWLKVLKLIANDLNKECTSKSWHAIASAECDTRLHAIEVNFVKDTVGTVYFCSFDAAQTAIRIMGDKLKFLNEK